MISFDNTSFLVNGRRVFLSAGEVHYARAPKAEWERILDNSKACGINTVAAYVFWGFHEAERGVFNFEGDRDLGHFLQLCADRGLHVFLRMGPYCCAEWNYGGFPSWLRDEPDIKIRTFNPAYIRRVELYFERLCAEVRPYLATRGGPVAMVQIENEYDNVARRHGEDGQRYLRWLEELATRLGMDVPRTMCEAGSSDSGGATDGTLATVNGFSISAERAESFRRNHPGLPMLWTELWPGWYDTWGFQSHSRQVSNIARYLLEFVALGGCGWNYYMWYGGTNFGRNSMYLQTTAYCFGSPLDEYGRITPRACFLRDLHAVLHEDAEIFFEGERSYSDSVTTWTKGDQKRVLTIEDQRALLTTETGAVRFDSAAVPEATPDSTSWRTVAQPEAWLAWSEPRPEQRSAEALRAHDPIEQLTLTRDKSDYCWYSTEINIVEATESCLKIPYCGDFLRVYLDGKEIGTTPTPLRECRGSTTPGEAASETIVQGVAVDLSEAHPQYSFELRFPVAPGPHRLEILATSVGMVKGEWMLSGTLETERKGIWSQVFLDEKALHGWAMHPCLAGEQMDLRSHPEDVNWNPAQERSHPLSWLRTRFSLTSQQLASDADFRLDATGLGKGMLFINGHALGRHWLIHGEGFGNDQFWVQQEKHGLVLDAAGVPTQRHYRIPPAWLREDNDLLIFEEQPSSVNAIGIEMRCHPS